MTNYLVIKDSYIGQRTSSSPFVVKLDGDNGNLKLIADFFAYIQVDI